MLNPWDALATGNVPVQASTGEPVAESGDRDKDTIPNSEISSKSVSKKFFQPYGGEIFQEVWRRPTKTSNLGTSF